MSVGYEPLIGAECPRCHAVYFPPVICCNKCGEETKSTVMEPCEGRVLTCTKIAQGPQGWACPYAIVVVELAKGVQVIAHTDDIDGLKTGGRVKIFASKKNDQKEMIVPSCRQR